MSWLLLVALLVAGCGSKKPDETKALDSPKKEEPANQRINLGAGHGDRYSLVGKRPKLWTVRWKSAVMVVYEEGGMFSGELTTVDGDIYKDNEVVSKFEGRQSTADKAKEVLILSGDVKIRSLNPPATMYCDRLRYEADKQIVKASGNIRIVGATGTVTGLSEIWTNPELTKVATPDMWGEQP